MYEIFSDFGERVITITTIDVPHPLLYFACVIHTPNNSLLKV